MNRRAFALVKSGEAGKSKAYLTGFTLIELLVMVAIIGILATIISLNVIGAQAKAKYAKVIADMATIGKAVNSYWVSNYSEYPKDVTYNTLPTDAGFSEYLSVWPKTPCNSNYYYDYENWSNDPVPVPNKGIIGIQFIYRNGSANRYIYYYNIHDFSSVADSLYRGVNIEDLSDKKITCSE
ncbi:MAG: prepilin-type N-terminal cleavage/methylation domain-containing protein [Patescibacteria group bacterium]